MSMPQDESAVEAAYDEVADTYADHFRSIEPELPVELAMVEHFASLLPAPRHVLDAGCGAGRMMPLLDSLGVRVEGVDLSPAMIRRAQADHGRFRSRVGSLTALPFPEDSFDGVFSWYSTIHSPDDDLAQILREARRVLRHGGVLLLAFQSGEGVTDVSQGYRRRGHDIALHRCDPHRRPDRQTPRAHRIPRDRAAGALRRCEREGRSGRPPLDRLSRRDERHRTRR